MKSSLKIGSYLFSTLALLAFIATRGFFITGCGSSGSSSSSVSGAFPDGFAVASPTASSSGSSGSLSPFNKFMKWITPTVIAQSDENPPQSLQAKLQALEDIHNATNIAGCFNFTARPLRAEGSVACYGPPVQLSGTPPDTGIVTTASLPGGDLGIWNITVDASSNEACAAGKINDAVNVATAPIDMAMFYQAALECVMRIRNIALPTEGQTVDLTTRMNEAISEAGGQGAPTFTSVTMQRGTNDSSGNPRYRATGSATINFAPPGSGSSISGTMEMMYDHLPQDASNATFRGRALFRMVAPLGSEFAGSNCPSTGNKTMLSSAIYSKSSATAVVVRARQAVFCAEVTFPDVVDSNGEIDPSKKYVDPSRGTDGTCPGQSLATNVSGWGDDFNQLTLEMNPVTFAMSTSTAWQAGRCDLNTRTFNATTVENSGTAWFGYGPDIAASVDVGEITGMICNWAGPGSRGPGSRTNTLVAQQQQMARNTTSGLFESSGVNITYAPTNDCNYAGGAAFGFVNTVTPPQPPMTDDHALSSTAVANNLVPLTTLAAGFNMPTMPTGSYFIP